MDTTTGRFTSMDSYLGSVDDPISLHKYLYANANPVNYIDPSGYFSLAELMEVVKTQGVLSGIEYLNVNTYLLYIKLESSAGGIIIKAVLDESFETLLEGNISLESIKWSAIEAIWKMAGVDVDLSVPKMIAESSESGRASAEKCNNRATELNNARGGRDAQMGTTAVMEAIDNETGEVVYLVSTNLSQKSAPKSIRNLLADNEIYIGGKGHAEQTIMNNKGTRYSIVAGGTSRNVCKDICQPLLEADGLTLGGPTFRGRNDKTKYRQFWRQ